MDVVQQRSVRAALRVAPAEADFAAEAGTLRGGRPGVHGRCNFVLPDLGGGIRALRDPLPKTTRLGTDPKLTAS